MFELDDQSISEDGQEGENDIDLAQEKEENQSRETAITRLIPYNVANAQVNQRQENRDNVNIHARQE